MHAFLQKYLNAQDGVRCNELAFSTNKRKPCTWFSQSLLPMSGGGKTTSLIKLHNKYYDGKVQGAREHIAKEEVVTDLILVRDCSKL